MRKSPHTAGHADTGRHPSLATLAITLIVLLTLTAITVGVTRVAWLDFGRAGNLWIALTIATIKGTLVALYFMHLRYEKPFNAVILVAALGFVLLFCGLTLVDTRQYEPTVQEYRDVDPVRYAPDLQQH